VLRPRCQQHSKKNCWKAYIISAVGGACKQQGECAAGLYCDLKDETATKTCMAEKTEGGACSKDYVCTSPDNQGRSVTCYDKSGSGTKNCWPSTHAAAADAACKSQGECVAGLYCDLKGEAATNTCKVPKTEGGACAEDHVCLSPDAMGRATACYARSAGG
jgi:hypothetical protein